MAYAALLRRAVHVLVDEYDYDRLTVSSKLERHLSSRLPTMRQKGDGTILFLKHCAPNAHLMCESEPYTFSEFYTQGSAGRLAYGIIQVVKVFFDPPEKLSLRGEKESLIW